MGQDASFTIESFIKRYNSDLANDFGNLLSRISNLLKKFFDSRIPQDEDDSSEGLDVKSKAVERVAIVRKKIDVMRVNEAIEIAKIFGSDRSPGFINGVLGSFLTEKLEFKA